MEALLGLLGLLGFVACLIWLIVSAIKRKSKKPSAIGIIVCFLLFSISIALSTSPDAEPESSSLSKVENSQSEVQSSKLESSSNQTQNETIESKNETSYKETTLYNVDWDKCTEDLKESVLNQEFFPYARDVYVAIDEQKKEIIFSAVVDDSTDPEVALDYADSLVRQYNLMANMQDSNIQLASKDYYGGLYDQYDVLIGVAPMSKTDNQDEWFVFHAIIAGAHDKNKIKLQKVYS